MIKIDMDIPKLDDLIVRLHLLREQLDEDGLQEYLNMLASDGEVSIQPILERNIYDLVYSSPVEMIVGDEYQVKSEPEYYERTEALFNAVRSRVEGNQIHLYIDDDYLKGRENTGSMETGTATNLDETPYSLRVENDFVYENEKGKDVLRKGSKYMQKTYEELKLQVLQGSRSPRILLMPLLGMWEN